MPIPRPFSGVDGRTRWLRCVLLSATLLGMVSCIPLWLTERDYPLVPVASWFPALPPPWDGLFLAVTLLSLIAAAWFHRPALSFFLVAALFLYFGDQNRGQPWFYLYWVLLLLSLFGEKPALAGSRVALSTVYVWAGIQKLNAVFFAAIPTWFASPVQDWGMPSPALKAVQTAIAAAPFIEIFIGLGVWIAPARKAALATALLLHGLSLVLLGPLGHNVNFIVWPWNLAMVALLLVLFTRDTDWCETFRNLRQSRCAAATVSLFVLLPILSWFGKWDSYFSFALYSANLARADVYVSETYRDRLPGKLRRFVEPVNDFDPSFQKPFVFEHLKWGVSELRVPPLSEPRAFAVMFRHVSAGARDASECHMLMETRAGKVLLFQPGQPPMQ